MSLGEEDRIAFDYEYSRHLDLMNERCKSSILDYDEFLEAFSKYTQEQCEVDL